MDMALDEEQHPNEKDAEAIAIGKTEVAEHDTLKYHLLGYVHFGATWSPSTQLPRL